MFQAPQLLAPARAPVPHPLLDVSSALQALTRHFCNEDGSLHLFPHESSSLCPLRPFLTRVAIKELIHFTGLCYSGGSSPCTQQAFHCSPASSGGKNHQIGSIILFTSLPALLTRTMLRYRKRKSVGMTSEKAGGEERRGTARAAPGAQQGAPGAPGQSTAAAFKAVPSPRTKPFKCTLLVEYCVLLHN